mmetsp:Transcript_3258/g.7756  ORF Transcript_3258/g.7756 Transcript_3258/m.7756 type:complete len:209 (-) Transcript_3258:1463-2089(-)
METAKFEQLRRQRRVADKAHRGRIGASVAVDSLFSHQHQDIIWSWLGSGRQRSVGQQPHGVNPLTNIAGRMHSILSRAGNGCMLQQRSSCANMQKISCHLQRTPQTSFFERIWATEGADALGVNGSNATVSPTFPSSLAAIRARCTSSAWPTNMPLTRRTRPTNPNAICQVSMVLPSSKNSIPEQKFATFTVPYSIGSARVVSYLRQA